MVRALVIVSWAVANEAYRILACAAAGHPESHWVAGVNRCRCGKLLS